MTRETCGYRGHVCNSDVQFISRYLDTNDYCVAGRRVSVSDDGSVYDATTEECEAIFLFELARYSWYLIGHAERKAQHGNYAWQEIHPFDVGINEWHTQTRDAQTPDEIIATGDLRDYL